ncbi:MAG TPA: EAL domain-containing protein [Paracoccus sp. (in: a-proteobacteria)]|nr:EAL domain-containing protein [Paracoccus sp. (in: a-proteobacteria)]
MEEFAFDPARIEAHFQPQLCCHTGAVTGFEMLARLRDPHRGLRRPAEFLPGLSPDQSQALTRAMLVQGLAALRHWDRAGHAVATVALNVAGGDLTGPYFADSVLWELDRQDIPPARLVIEVMEELSPLEAPRLVDENLRRLRAAGCRIDLDDFGTGHASLDAIRRLGVHRVKIDRSFVTGCDRDADQQRTILAVLALAEHLRLETLAEGVETAGEHAFAAQIGCSHVQGYAVAAPMPLTETDGFLAQCRAQAAELPLLRRRA